MKPISPFPRFVQATLAGAALLLLAPAARAAGGEQPDRQPLPTEVGDFSLKVEPGVAFPLSSPQSDLFQPGGGETVKALWALTRYLDIGPSASYMIFSPKAGGQSGTAWTLGGGLQLKRPHDFADHDSFFGLSPWVDVDGLYVRTGVLDRPGFAAAVGLVAPIGQSRIFWVGPFVRYLQIVQGDAAGNDNRDAKLLTLGVSFEFGEGVRREPAPVPAAEVRIVTKETFVCQDADHDGLPDDVDRCPDVAGPIDNFGCPRYAKIVVKPDKLELKERIQFAWDQAKLEEVSFPVLNEVVQALTDNKRFHVQVEGNTSSEGGDDHNQKLSDARAGAVVDYLVAHGIARDRLSAKGFGSSVPVDTNTTLAGRENNRRVEFIVQFKILPTDGSK